MPTFSDLKAESLRYYLAWTREKTYCRALSKNVIISREGWHHLMSGNKTKKRLLKDKINRLKLLKAAKFTITNSKKAFLEIRNRTKYYTLESDFYYKNKKLQIRVVLKEDKAKNLTFFSVMRK